MSVRKTRNDRPFWYCLYESAEEIVDEWGNSTGELTPTYSEPVEMYANISPATGLAQTEMFGGLDSYDKVIVTSDMDCPIDEYTVLFVDKEPEHNLDDGLMYDYIVKRVAKSLNSISIAIRKVEVG